jgi:ornithine carbamoyltransferase
MHISAKLGANFTIASPADYDIKPEAISFARNFALESGSTLEFLRDPHEAVKGAHVIYTDTWTSMGQEEETAKREKVFPPYQVNAALVSEARKDVIVLHCLPAHRGYEITDEVADGLHSRLFPQAHNRLHAQKGILVHLLRKD